MKSHNQKVFGLTKNTQANLFAWSYTLLILKDALLDVTSISSNKNEIIFRFYGKDPGLILVLINKKFVQPCSFIISIFHENVHILIMECMYYTNEDQ